MRVRRLEFAEAPCPRSHQTAAVIALLLVLCFGLAPPCSADPGVSVSGRVLTEPGGTGVNQVSVMLWHDGSRYTETDQHGEYVFDDVEAGDYTLRIDRIRPGIWSEGVVVEVGEVGATDNAHYRAGNLYLRLRQSISGSVIDLDTGQPAPGVEINFSTAEGNREVVSPDEEGRYRLYVLPRQVEIRCEGTFDRYYVENPRDNAGVITVAGGENVDTVDYEVRSAPKFTGRVILPNGEPAPGLFVLANANWMLATQRASLIDAARTSVPRDQQEAMRAIQRTMQQLDAYRDTKHLLFETSIGRSFINTLDSLFGTSIGPSYCYQFSRFGTGFGRYFRLSTDQDGNFVGYLRRASGPDLANATDEALDLVIAARLPDSSLAIYTLIETTTLDQPPRDIQLQLQPTASVRFTITDPDGNAILNARPLLYARPSLPGFTSEFEMLGQGKHRASGLIPGLEYSFGAKAAGYKPAASSDGLRVVPKPGEEIDLGILQLERSLEAHNPH
jgi:carboxypeptidase family protein